MTSSILVGMLVTRFCRKAGFLGLMGLRGLAFAKERILLRVLSDILILIRGTMALQSSIAALLSLFFRLFPAMFFTAPFLRLA